MKLKLKLNKLQKLLPVFIKKKQKEARSIKNVGSYSFCCQCGPKM